MKSMLRFFFLMSFLFTAVNAFTEENAVIELFSPQGIVKGVRQVTVRFSEQMVPFGDPKAVIQPFDIDSSEKGTGRWVDGKNWVFDFERDLPAGVVCTFKLKSGIKTLSGKKIRGEREFKFSTGGPSIINTNPYKESQYINEDQVFILNLDAEPDNSSVLKNVFFSVDGIQDLIGIKIIDGKEREEIIKAESGYEPEAKPSIILIQSKQQFPSDTKISLVWGKNVKSKNGVSNTQDQLIRFKTRQAFSAECHCERENANSDCIPMLPISLNFSSTVPRDQAMKIVLKGSGKTWKPEFSEGEDENSVYGVRFNGPFPEKKNFTIVIPNNLKDDSGRRLVNADKFPLSVSTDKYPPLAKFAANFGILELKADPVLPVTLRNIESDVKARMLQVGKKGIVGSVVGKIMNVQPKGDNFQEWLRIVGSAERDSSILGSEGKAKEFKVPKPSGAAAFEVVGIPLKEPGLYVVELESDILGASLLGKQAPMYVTTAVLVTNLSVHFKWGRESSLVWVTALNTGEPVKDAVINVKDCAGKILWQGKSDTNGIARISSGLPSSGSLPDCKYNSIGSGLFVTAQLENDISFVFSSWDNGIEPWRFQLPSEYYNDPSVATTVFDRTLLRAGETIHMKHFIRNHGMTGFSMMQKDKLPDKVIIYHIGSDEKFEGNLSWDAKGIAETSFPVPKDAKLGTYQVILQRGAAAGREYNQLHSGEFRVEEFRVPLLKAVIKPPTEPLINAKDLQLYMNVQYLAGGGAGSLPVKLRSEIRKKEIASFEGFTEFTFGNGFIKEGLTRGGQYMEGGEEAAADKSGRLPSIELNLDKTGGARAVVPDIPKAEQPQEILTEIEFKDPNGEVQTVSSRIPLWSSGYLVGIKPDSWALSKDKFKFHAAVVDIAGKPVANAAVRVKMFTRKNYTHRKRLVGGFYAYEYMTEIKEIATVCEGKTDAKGLLICEVGSPVSGNVILQAESSDASGNKTAANCDVWVAGKDEWWFDVSDNDRIDLLPLKKSYEQGDTALFQVRMPFRSATALITVEREGVIESWVKKLSGKEPVIEVPVKGYYAPNCFVSVLAVRGRVSGVQPTALVDMGRPAYKLGIAEIKVGWRYHELKVSVLPDRKVYNIREKAKVRVKVMTAGGKVPPKGSEVAIAAVDEGLLELMPNRSWDILSAMMGQRAYEVDTSTAQMQVIGKRHFGLKALPQGGGGGRETTRELFDTLLLWKGRVVLDDKGEANIEIPINDSITGFRIVAVAQGGIGLFGYGYSSIQSTQDLMILSGLPPVVREGDMFNAGFTVRNTTNKAMEIDLHAKVDGLTVPLKTLAITLQPGESQEAGWDVSVPAGIQNLSWETSAKERDGKNSDTVKINQRVVQAVPVGTYQATIFQLDKNYKLSVERPKEAIPGKGGVRVSMRSKIADGQSGISDYMKNYPYTCMEQQVSIAVSLRNEAMWGKAMSSINSYLDSNGMVKYFPSCLYGSPVLTSYIIAIGNESGWEIPQQVKERMANALKGFVDGTIAEHSTIETADLSMRKLSAIEALSRSGNAQAKLLDSVSIEPNLWPTSSVIDWFNILQNIKDIPRREERIREAENILRSRLNFQGTKMGFSTSESDNLWWLMVSNDVNSVRLILSMIHANKWNDDMPRLIQGALSRQKNGAWDLTLANAWGILALDRFSRAFEKIPVAGETSASLGGEERATNWNNTPSGKISFFAWPSKKDDLSIFHKGNGKPWITVQSLAAIPLKEPLSSGYKIRKTIKPVEQKQSGKWSSGDIYRVRLEIEAQADQTWVVVSDPVPAGATILGKGLARDSELLTGNESGKGRAWLAYEERGFEAFRAYYEYVPKGKWELEYTVRVNQQGSFRLPATRVEALYFPEMFGEIPNEGIEIDK